MLNSHNEEVGKKEVVTKLKHSFIKNTCPVTSVITYTYNTSIDCIHTRIQSMLLQLSIEELDKVYETNLSHAIETYSLNQQSRNTLIILFHGYLNRSGLIDSKFINSKRNFDEQSVLTNLDLMVSISRDLVRYPSYLKSVPKLNPIKTTHMSSYLKLVNDELTVAKALYKQQLLIKSTSSKLNRNLSTDDILNLTYDDMAIVSKAESKLNLLQLKYAQTFKETKEAEDFILSKGMAINLLNSILYKSEKTYLLDIYLELLTKSPRQLVIADDTNPEGFEQLLDVIEDWVTQNNTKPQFLRWVESKAKVFNSLYEEHKIVPLKRRASASLVSVKEVKDFFLLADSMANLFDELPPLPKVIDDSTYATRASHVKPIDFDNLDLGTNSNYESKTSPLVSASAQRILDKIRAAKGIK